MVVKPNTSGASTVKIAPQVRIVPTGHFVKVLVVAGALSMAAGPINATLVKSAGQAGNQGTVHRSEDLVMSSTVGGGYALALDRAHDRILYLGTLPAGWNTYNSPPISRLAIKVANRLLEIIREQGARIPQIVPTSDGGIQFEWSQAGTRLEFEIDDEGLLSYFYSGPGEEREGALSGGVQDPLTSSLLSGTQQPTSQQ